MTIETANEWAIANGYTEIDTSTSDEFVAWQECDWDPKIEYGPSFTGVKAWRDCRWPDDDRFVAIYRYENGEQMGERRGFGETMLAALQDL